MSIVVRDVRIKQGLVMAAALFGLIFVASCEGLHHEGPGPVTAVFATSLNFTATDCSVCHGDPPQYGQRAQWGKSGHSNYLLAQELGTSASCTRCHSSQGFQLWLKQGMPDPTLGIQGVNGTATAAEMVALGFTRDKVEPQTCATCHDPNGPGGNLRVMNDTPLLASGYKATGLGKGAVCIMCHNSRTNIRDWTATIGYGLPHVSVQGDVLMGQNVYLIADKSPRSPYAIKDSCVTCHMGPPQKDLAYYLARPQKSAHYKYKETCPT